MRIHFDTDCGIRILQYLHEHKNDIHTATELAAITHVSYQYVVKVTGALRRGGLIMSVQGRNGGFVLAKPAHEISLYDVYCCTAKEIEITEGLKMESFRKDEKLYDIYRSLQEKIIAELSKSIADISN
ncbi:MAG: Rrf2 family transcriptional regulator [Oscillospiraceae bacterium]|nr:Rrf2 family transcriptional regulator [Oscillospiraceae bacterium]